MAATVRWQEIRQKRRDLTDYVIHFTGDSSDRKEVSAQRVLSQILRDTYIKPSFSPMSNRFDRRSLHNTVKGPYPVICFTEMPLWSVIETRKVFPGTMGFGIAYHKRCLYRKGGRPVIYGDMKMLGTEIKPGDDKYIPNRVIYTGGILPRSHQYLWAMFDPHDPDETKPNVDFSWEREWRIKVDEPGLPVVLKEDLRKSPRGMIIVEKDIDKMAFSKELVHLAKENAKKYHWAKLIRIVSLETAEREIRKRNYDYSRLETWPEQRS